MARYEAASSIIGNINFKKVLFQSPTPATESKGSPSTSTSAASDPSASLIYRVQLEQDTDMNLYYIKKDLHVQRLKDLRELAGKLQDDAWKYEPAEKLIGLQ